MSRFKQKKYLPLILPLVLLIAVLAVNQDWSIAGGTSYTWTNIARVTGYTDGSGGVHTLTPPVTASAVVIVTSTSAQEELCFIPPVLTAEAGTNQSTICSISGVTLGGSSWTATGGTPPYAYQWSCDQPVCNISITTDENPTVSPDFRETIYTVTVTDTNDCQASDSVLVTVEDAPFAVAIISTTIACTNETVTFDGSGSNPLPLSYIWDFDDLSGPDTNMITTHSYSIPGVFDASLTVTDLNGCKDTDYVTIYVTSGVEPVGLISFDFGPTSIFADGSSTTIVTSSPITDCLGGPLTGYLVTVMTDRGTIRNGQLIDEDPAPGIQLLTDEFGRISFTLQSGTIGGTATVMARSVDGYAEGASQIEFFGSTSLPIVTGFYPSGYIETGTFVSEIYVQFNKNMDEGSVCDPLNFYVVDVTDTSTSIVGSCEYDEQNRTAKLTGLSLDMMNKYRVIVTGNVVDIYGNPLDGNYNGIIDVPRSDDDFTWTFGNTMDRDGPTITCGGHAPEPLSPDGDGFNDSTTISAHIQDIGMPPSGIKMWQVLILDGNNVIRTLIKQVEEAATDITDSIEWNGKDEDGLVVDNGVYNYMLKAIDNDGNWFVAVCNDQILVKSALDPAYFRGPSGSVD